MAQAAHDLGTENLLVVPGAVHIPWRDDHEPVPNDVCDRRAREAVGKLLPTAEKLKVYLNIENIFFNGYLMTPMEMNAFVDRFGSKHVRVHFDTGNIMLFQHPRALDRASWAADPGTSTSRSSRRRAPTTRWSRSARCSTARPTGRRSGGARRRSATTATCTFEYFHPYPHYPEALVYQTSDSLDRILGRK